MEIVEILNITILFWMSIMLSVQSWILWKLLPEIKQIVKNSSLFNIFKKKESDPNA